MGVRRHIAALVLFGVQLLQGVLPAAGAACDRPTAPASAAVVSGAAPSGHEHHHAMAMPAQEPLAGGTSNAPDSAPAPHPHAPAACPMAMACAAVGVVSLAVAVSTVDVAIDEHRPVHVANWPVSLDVAPEPPPPRG